MGTTCSLIFFLLFLCFLLSSRADPSPPIDLYLYINAANGEDNSTCGLESTPCKSLSYAIQLSYDQGVSSVQITLQSDIKEEVVEGSPSIFVVSSITVNFIVFYFIYLFNFFCFIFYFNYNCCTKLNFYLKLLI